MRRLKPILPLLLLLAFVLPWRIALAQNLTLNIVNGIPSAIPITIVPFTFESAAQPPTTHVAAIIRNDLDRSGKFRALPLADVIEHPSQGSQIQFQTWKLLKQNYIVIGRERNSADGQVKVDFDLWSVLQKKRLLAGSYTVLSGDLRGVAHQIADQIYQQITGVPGAFYTRIAYVTTTGNKKHLVWSLIVADSDGHSPQVVVRSKQPLLSPDWSPNGQKLAYVSFESGNSAIYIQNLATGQRELISGRKGVNGAPRFSPDGAKLAMMLSFAGSPEIYVMNLKTRALTQITHSLSINTEPRWLPDGKALIFTSDRSGWPQLYQVPIVGGSATRLTFHGQINADSSINYDASQIAMVQANGSVYRIAIMDRKLGNQVRFISPGPMDESPSFAPNGSMLLYAASDGVHGVLYEVSDDGRVRQRLSLVNGNVQSPAWGPYRKQ